MASKIENSFGSRLANAQKLATYLEGFTGYTPVSPEFSLTVYQQMISEIFQTNSQLAEAQTRFTKTVDSRQQIFNLSPDGMIKRLPHIAGYVKALFGKTSVEAEMVISKINKIRGEKAKRLRKDQEGEFVSQSQASYGAVILNFSNLIDTLVSFGASYAPPESSRIQLVTLQALMTQMNHSSELVNQSYAALKSVQDERLRAYEVLHSRSQRIKETIKALYGLSSDEYKLVKGLKI